MTICPEAMLNALEHLKMTTNPMAMRAYIMPNDNPVTNS